jgi:hypothetical protein
VLLTSSILEIISELSWRVAVPPEHVQAGRTFSTYQTSAVFDTPIFCVHTAAEKPVGAYVAVYELAPYGRNVESRNVTLHF